MDKYENYVIKYNESVEAILEEAIDILLSKLKITKELFENSLDFLMEKGFYQQIYMLQATIRQKIKLIIHIIYIYLFKF